MHRIRRLTQLAKARSSIARVGRWSDSLVRIGPFGLGLDGLLAWVPLIPAGALYSLLAGGFLLLQGWRARVPLRVMAQALGLLTARTLLTGLGESALPLIVLELGVDLLRAHKWSADLMLRAIDQTHYVEGPKDVSNPRFGAADAVRRSLGKARVVFLG